MERYTQLAPDLRIARVLTGLWQIADMEREGRNIDLDHAAAAMHSYVEAGFTTFDMADHYGSAEDIAGIYQQQLHPERSVQLLTKWVPPPGPLTAEIIQQAVQKSLIRLQASQLDLLQFHAWNYAHPQWLDGLFGLQELQKKGLIRHLGLTNFDTAHLRIALTSGVPIVSNQVCFSLLDRRAGGAMAQLCEAFGVKILAFGTLAGGFLSERWLDKPEPTTLDTWSQMKYKRFIDVAGGWDIFQRLLRVLNQVAQRHQVSIANVASRYILEQPAVGGVIIGARLGKSAHIAENQRLFAFALSEADQQEIAQAVAALKPIPGDCGDEYRKPPFLTASGDLSHHLDGFPAPYATRTEANGTVRAFSGTSWEDMAGYCRAIKVGNRISVSGTTATHGPRAIGGQDITAQTHFVIDKIEGALQSLGSSLNDVIRTRVFVSDINNWEAAARAHGERFASIQPANTMVQAKLVGDEYLVEIEAEAVVQ